MTSPSIEEFEAKGWFLSQAGIDLIASENEGLTTLDDYISCAKNVRTFSYFFTLSLMQV
jgi:hypothetical protein